MSSVSVPSLGFSNILLHCCHSCSSGRDIHRRLICHDLPFFIEMNCSTCRARWYICTECTNIRNHYISAAQLLRHVKLKHNSSLDLLKLCFKKCTDTDIDQTTAVEASREDIATFSSPAASAEMQRTKVMQAGFSGFNECSFRYFNFDFNRGNPCEMLVSHSQFPRGVPSGHILDPFEVNYHMDVAHFAGSLTRNQCESFGNILRRTLLIHEKHLKNGDSSTNVIPTSFATTSSRVRNLYLVGKSSINSNLPIPNVKMIDSHAYVSLKDCIRDVLAHGLPMDFISFRPSFSYDYDVNVHKMSESYRAYEIWKSSTVFFPENDCLVMYLNEWSDDFEPLSSVKSNRGSCWIKSVTIAPAYRRVHSMVYTYPIAIGRKGCSHESVEKAFAEELHELRSSHNCSFYSKAHGGNVNVYIDLFVSLQDQPERRSANCVMLGSSKFSACWGVIGNFAANASKIPSCQDCFKALLQNVAEQNITCENCTNWNLSSDSKMLHFDPPINYPSTELLGEDGKISPMKLEYSSMIDAVSKTHRNVANGLWSVDNGKAFLYVNGLNTETMATIIDCALNAGMLNRAYNAGNPDVRCYNTLCTLKRHFPHKFEQWSIPAMWSRGTTLSQHIDTVMHLLFLGVVKTTVKYIETWVKARGCYDPFLQFMKGILESVMPLRLRWCNAQPYCGGNFSGWVSENYLCFARLLPWVYSRLDHLASDPVRYEDPCGPQHKWTKKQNVAWLRNRRLSTVGKAAEVSARVVKYMTQRSGPPPIMQLCGCSVQDVKNMILSLHAMTSSLMQRTASIPHINECEKRIKIFLTTFENFDCSLRGNKQSPKWLTSYNFICLLNLPTVLLQYGPLPNLWEGGGQGEKIIGVIKSFFNGYRAGWQCALMKSTLKDMALSRMSDEQKCSNVCRNWATNNVSIDYSDIRRYRSLFDARSSFRKALPLSTVKLKAGSFGALVQNPGGYVVLQLEKTSFVETILGLHYFSWTIPTYNEMNYIPLIDSDVVKACLFLPLLTVNNTGLGSDPIAENGNLRTIYCVVDSEWNTLQQDMVFSCPTVDNDIQLN